MVRSHIIFQTVLEKMPELSRLFDCVILQDQHSTSANIILLLSDEGVQQGDPLGPLLFECH